MPRFIADLSLRKKLMFITMSIVLAATVTTLLFLQSQASLVRSDQFVQQSLAQTRLVAEYVVSPLVFDDNKGARELLAKFALDPRVVSVRIEDVRGARFAEVVSSSAPQRTPPSPLPVPAVLPSGQPWLMHDGILYVTVPITHQGPLGHLRVAFRSDDLESARGEEQRFLLLVLGGVILASYLLTMLLQGIISTPLLRLEKHARQMAESQDLTTPLEAPGRDEVGSLYHAFNHLIDRIRRREDDILALNRSLEAKVVERTRDLEVARDKADRASSSKSEFLANMSHEIRTPINAITGFASLALRTDLSAKQLSYLDKIRSAAQGLLRIVNDLLDFSKIEAGHLEMEQVPFRLAEVMETVVAYVGTLAEQKNIELLINVAPEVPARLVGDPLRLSQILTNLCNNAVKFTERGEVEVDVVLESYRDDKVQLRFTVRDTGIGLSPEQSGKLFNAFTQADTSTTRRFGGTGLGLVISRRLVEMMNGRIWLESQLGLGTTFFVVVELGKIEAGTASLQGKETADTAARAGDMRGRTALVVDDNSHARQILVTQLQAMGVRARAVESGEGALLELRRASTEGSPYPLVLMDWKMPGMDGISATRAIRADPLIAGTPVVIMVTAFGREQAVSTPENMALLDGMLLKPVTAELLAETLSRALGHAGGVGNDRSHVVWRTARLNGARLLLVEDNPINQQLAQELLEQEGAIVDVAGNGRVALEMLQAKGYAWYDAALVDLQMPEMDGYEATRRIRAIPEAGQLPLIAMTAHAMLEERERCLKAGMQDHISKPIDPELMATKLVHWIGADRLARAVARPQPGSSMDAAKPLPSDDIAALALPTSLPGIDLASGLRRCGGDTQLLRELLLQFRTHYSDAAEKLSHLVNKGNAADLLFLAHTVKGAAANLGIDSVAASAAVVEVSAHDGNDCSMLIADFSVALDLALAAIGSLDVLRGAVIPDGTGRHAEPSEKVRELVRELATCLRHNDTRAETLIGQVRDALQGSAPQWLLDTEAAVNNLDYLAALHALQQASLIEAN